MALVLIALIVIPMQSSAATESLWDDARITDEIGTKYGTIGGISIELSNTTYEESTSGITDLPSIVEVYTATWCSNCIKTEQALDDAIGNLDVTRIHYHRHLYETLDPFGSNSTDSRWVENYGAGSLLSTERSMSASDGGVITIPGTESSKQGLRRREDVHRNQYKIQQFADRLLYRTGIGIEPPLLIKWLNFPRSVCFHVHAGQRPGGKPFWRDSGLQIPVEHKPLVGGRLPMGAEHMADVR